MRWESNVNGRLRRLRLTAPEVLGDAVIAFGLNGHFALALPLVALAGGAAAWSSVNRSLLMQGAAFACTRAQSRVGGTN